MNDGNDEVKKVKIAFEREPIDLPIERLMAMKAISPGILKSAKFRQILASVEVEGLVEFPTVFPPKKTDGKYLLLDGHLRVEALKLLGKTEVTCLVSTDNESFTYNKLLNRISPIQEHRMIRKAIDSGVPREDLARVLDLGVASIDRKSKLLEGICTEVVDLLKDKVMPANVFMVLKRMMPMRQIVAAEMMNRTGRHSHSFARSILIGSKPEELIDPVKSKKMKGLSDDDIAQMEAEMASLQSQYQILDETYGDNTVDLMLMQGYLRKLLENASIVKFISKKRPDYLSELQKIAEMKSLKDRD